MENPFLPQEKKLSDYCDAISRAIIVDDPPKVNLLDNFRYTTSLKAMQLQQCLVEAMTGHHSIQPFQRQHTVISEIPSYFADVSFPRIPHQAIVVEELDNTAVLCGEKWDLRGSNTETLTAIVPIVKEGDLDIVCQVTEWNGQKSNIRWGSDGSVKTTDEVGCYFGEVNLLTAQETESPKLGYDYVVYHGDNWKFLTSTARVLVRMKGADIMSVEGKRYGKLLVPDGFYEMEVINKQSHLEWKMIRPAVYAYSSVVIDNRILGVQQYSDIINLITRRYKYWNRTFLDSHSEWFDPYHTFMRVGDLPYNAYFKDTGGYVWLGKLRVNGYHVPNIRQTVVDPYGVEWTSYRDRHSIQCVISSKKDPILGLPYGIWYKRGNIGEENYEVSALPLSK